MVTHTIPSGTNRLMNRNFEAVPSELRLQASPATANKVKWTLAAALVCVLVVTFTFMTGMGPAKHRVNVYGKPLPFNGMMRADSAYECDADWYCHTNGANCSAQNAIVGSLDPVVAKKCEFRKMAHDLSSVMTFLALASELMPQNWPCKNIIANNCDENMPYGCPYVELCGTAEQDNIEDVVVAASEFTPSQTEALPNYRTIWKGFDQDSCSIVMDCEGVTFDSNLCSKKEKLRLARKLIGKAMASVSMDLMTASSLADMINCMSCPVTVSRREFVCLDADFQRDLGALFAKNFDTKLMLPNSRSFADIDDAAAQYQPEWSELAVCHPLCKTFLKGNVGIFTHVYEMCCATASHY